jgi:hypothetical protein
MMIRILGLAAVDGAVWEKARGTPPFSPSRASEKK